jgi:hypothetical protein
MVYAEMGEMDQAEKEIDFVNMTSIDEGYIKPHIVDTKGYVYYRKGNYKEALKYFDKAIKKPTLPGRSKRLYWFHKGNCYLRLKDMKNAIRCYNSSKMESRLLDDNHLDILNNKAVAYYNNNEKDQAISEFKDILKIKYDYIPAHHNLLKVSSNETRYSSFWNYWQDSSAKKYFAGLVIALITSIIIITIVAPGISLYTNQSKKVMPTTENTTTTFTVMKNGSAITTKNVTSNTKPLDSNSQNKVDIPVYALIIRSASIGTTSFELTTIDRAPDKQAELEFVEK